MKLHRKFWCPCCWSKYDTRKSNMGTWPPSYKSSPPPPPKEVPVGVKEGVLAEYGQRQIGILPTNLNVGQLCDRMWLGSCRQKLATTELGPNCFLLFELKMDNEHECAPFQCAARTDCVGHVLHAATDHSECGRHRRCDRVLRASMLGRLATICPEVRAEIAIRAANPSSCSWVG